MSFQHPSRKFLNSIYYISAILIIAGAVMQLNNLSFYFLFHIAGITAGSATLIYEVGFLRRYAKHRD